MITNTTSEMMSETVIKKEVIHTESDHTEAESEHEPESYQHQSEQQENEHEQEHDQENCPIPYKTLKGILREKNQDIFQKFKKDTLYRHTNDRENDYYIRNNSLKTCKKILILMLLSKIDPENYRQAYILFAEMQTGKSGIFTNVCFIIFRNQWIREFLQLKYLLILTPMSDSSFMEQLEKDIEQRIGGIRYFRDNSEYKFIGMNAEGEKGFRGKQLNGLIESGQFTSNTLTVIDEVHFGSDANQSTQTLLKNIGISNSANTDNLREKNMYLLGVSATPFSEIVSIKQFQRKHLIQHRTPSAYYGIKKHMERGMIKQSFSLNSKENIQKFIEIVKEYKNKKTYIIARIRNSGKENDRCEKVKKELIIKFPNVIVNIIDQKSTERDFKKLTANEPSVLTIYLIKNMLSAGKRIEKKYISVVFEHIAKARSYNETIVQSLIGRICGYSEHNIICYTDLEHANEYIKVVDTKFQSLPKKGKNYRRQSKQGTSIRKLYLEDQPQLWPKTKEECDALVSASGAIGLEFSNHEIFNQKFVDSKQLEKRIKVLSSGATTLEAYAIGHSEPKIWDVSNEDGLNEIKQKLKGHGSISSKRPKMRYPVLYNGEIIYAICYFGGIRETDKYETEKRASSHIVHDYTSSSCSSSSDESSSSEEDSNFEDEREMKKQKEQKQTKREPKRDPKREQAKEDKQKKEVIQIEDLAEVITEESKDTKIEKVYIESIKVIPEIDTSMLKSGRKGNKNISYSVIQLREICKKLGIATTFKGKCIKKEDLANKIKEHLLLL
jgi:hypothetical protein